MLGFIPNCQEVGTVQLIPDDGLMNEQKVVHSDHRTA